MEDENDEELFDDITPDDMSEDDGIVGEVGSEKLPPYENPMTLKEFLTEALSSDGEVIAELRPFGEVVLLEEVDEDDLIEDEEEVEFEDDATEN